MLKEDLIDILNKREFVSVATCDFEGRPNAAPKFLLKVDKDSIYLVDYTISTTWKNLKINPRISISFMDTSTLNGYQINGSVKILDKGRLYDKMRGEMLEREVRLTAKHIIEDIRGEAKHENFEIVMAEKFVIFKITVDEIVKIGIGGELERERKFIL